MEQQHLAIATVPIQSWETLYDWDQALATGTIFPGLNKPFFVLEENPLRQGLNLMKMHRRSSRRESG